MAYLSSRIRKYATFAAACGLCSVIMAGAAGSSLSETSGKTVRPLSALSFDASIPASELAVEQDLMLSASIMEALQSLPAKR